MTVTQDRQDQLYRYAFGGFVVGIVCAIAIIIAIVFYGGAA